jgi:putative GTP pyrophosphokinase
VDAHQLEDCIAEYRRNRHHLTAWAESIRQFFANHPVISVGDAPIVHSIRVRLKDEDHLREKIRRKAANNVPTIPDRLLEQITDLAGVRILHLYQAQFENIHTVVREQLARGDWSLHEEPVAYTWDPESTAYFEKLGLVTELKESYYTSIHYVLKPRADSFLCCELQVRTLFEEAWGEIDHGINYPRPTAVRTCQEQLRVLSKVVGAATRLADSIFRANSEGENRSVKTADSADGSAPGAA